MYSIRIHIRIRIDAHLKIVWMDFHSSIRCDCYCSQDSCVKRNAGMRSICIFASHFILFLKSSYDKGCLFFAFERI